MVAIAILLFVFICKNIQLNLSRPVVNIQAPIANETINMTSHLDFPHIKKICISRHNTNVCKLNTTELCGMRFWNNQAQYEDFENSCFMFLSNMCDYPGEEFHIISSGTCSDFRKLGKQIKARRDDVDEKADQYEEEANVEQETEVNIESTEQNSGNYAENLKEDNTDTQLNNEDEKENAEPVKEEAEQNKENQKQENTEANDKLNKLGNPEELNKSEAIENNGNDEERNTNATKNVDDYTGTEDSASDAKVKHSKAAARQGSDKKTTTKDQKKKNPTAVTVTKKTTPKMIKTTKKWVPLYPVDEAFDGHICPLSCPSTYSPVCVSVNRGYGKDFRLFTFINHCLGDLFYCKHSHTNDTEFKPPDGESDEMVVGSPLSWSFCAASRYIQFARFAEVASSMGHYGWLGGHYRATHIMEPHERMPGYG